MSTPRVASRLGPVALLAALAHAAAAEPAAESAPEAESPAEPVAESPAEPAPAPAAEPASGITFPPVNLTATMTAGVHTDQDYGELFGRLNASTVMGPWQLALRLDTATFIAPSSPPSVDRYVDRYALEKASLGWTWRSLQVTAGDSYVSFGRGLALSLRKVDELGIDTTLRGAKVAIHEGELGATLVVGYANINNVDEATGTSVDDPYDLVGGLQAQMRLADRWNLGAHGSAIAFRDALGLVERDPYTDRSFQFGVTLDAPRLGDRFGFYLEGMAQAASIGPAPEQPLGFGLYGTATAYLGQATLLFEGKAYGALTPLDPDLDAPFDIVAYNSPPTVERVLQEIENPQRDIAGGRLRLDWSLSPALLAHVSYGLFRDWHGYADPYALDIRPGTIQDPYAGVEARWDDARSWAIAGGGWRVVVVDGSGAIVRRDGHVELDVAQTLDQRWSLTLHVAHQERKKHESPLLDHEFREGTISAGFRLRPWITVAGGYDYTTEPTQLERDYFHGNFSWDITPSSSLRLFVGSARGGLRCVSGVCRLVPPFEGVKLVATLRF
jgi:hypothetical protein